MLYTIYSVSLSEHNLALLSLTVSDWLLYGYARVSPGLWLIEMHRSPLAYWISLCVKHLTSPFPPAPQSVFSVPLLIHILPLLFFWGMVQSFQLKCGLALLCV